MMKSSILMLVSVFLVGCATAGPMNTVKVEEAAAWLDKVEEVQVVDVRRPDEFAGGHLKGAVLVTWGGEDFEKQALAKVAKDQPVLVYCRSGRRSTAAAEVLDKLGYSRVKNLDGGITAWKAAGKPVTSGE